MYTPSPAVEWLETSPESPYNLENARIKQRYELENSVYCDGPHEIWKAFPPHLSGTFHGSVYTTQPMVCIRRDEWNA
jgi:hypothetical protein